MKKQVRISEEEIQKALQKFQKEGGLISKLPDEVIRRSPYVGGKFAMYEAVIERTGA